MRPMPVFVCSVALALALGLALAAPASAQSPDFIAFESGPVQPIALSPDGTELYVANTPDNRLEIFSVQSNGIIHTGSVEVGLEPVTVVPRTNDEVWVVNHLSDSVSIVALGSGPPHVSRTVVTGDEPRGLVFARGRAFIATAHRGQQRLHPSIQGAYQQGQVADPQLTTPGVGRADVWVFDVDDLDQGASDPTPGGVPERILELFADTPRALATDGNTVWAAAFMSGNRTTVLNEGVVCNNYVVQPCGGDGISVAGGLPNGQMPGGNPGPAVNVQGIAAPEVGLIVQFDPQLGQWVDELGRNWTNGVRFSLPDKDVFAIDAQTLNVTTDYSGVGTVLFNMAVNPVNGNVYVSNLESQNLTRFEGPGITGGSTVQGNLAQSRITVLNGSVKPRHLNRHIDYGVLPAPAGVAESSLATPVDLVVSSDGATLYVAAFGSSKVGVFATADLENDGLFDLAGTEFDPTVESANYIQVPGGGPAGIALDEANQRLYVLTRFDNSVATIDLSQSPGQQVSSVPLFNPEPADLVEGRPFLYDALLTSSNGEASCASCHIFGDKDELAWELGDPDGLVSQDFIPRTIPPLGDQNGGAANNQFHPMKGPMTTQTLRGLENSGAMHWRGDRVDGLLDKDNPYTADPEISFNNFIVAFEGLVGREENIEVEDMQKFTDFALQLILPPNPIRALDQQLTADQQAGENFFFGPPSDILFNCNGCHTLNPAAVFFGTGGLSSFEGELQIFKIPHLRNMYTKVGMFGMADTGFIAGNLSNQHLGDQVRGFGFLHDGSVDTLERFLSAFVFQFPNADTRRDSVEFMMAFDSDLAPVVGQQVSYDGSGDLDLMARIDLLEHRAGTSFTSEILGGVVTECDLVVKGVIDGEPYGFLYDPNDDDYQPDRNGEPPIGQAALLAMAGGGDVLNFTCVPPGSGMRVGLDRDRDGVYDGTERADGTDPDNAGSFVGACSNGIDDDGDGDTDTDDAGCKNAGWDNENPECSDGKNNDPDGLADAADPQCAGKPYRLSELPNAGCGLGGEVALLLPLLLGRLRRPRRRA